MEKKNKKERKRVWRRWPWFDFPATYLAIPLCKVGFTLLVRLRYSEALFRCQRRVFAAGEEVLKLAPSENGERLHHHCHGRGRKSIELLVGVKQQLQKIVAIDIRVRKRWIPLKDLARFHRKTWACLRRSSACPPWRSPCLPICSTKEQTPAGTRCRNFAFRSQTEVVWDQKRLSLE